MAFCFMWGQPPSAVRRAKLDEGSTGSASKRLLHLCLHPMRELFNLLSLLDSLHRHNSALGPLQVILEFRSKLQHLLGIAPDLNLPLQVRGNRLLSLNVAALGNRSSARSRNS